MQRLGDIVTVYRELGEAPEDEVLIDVLIYQDSFGVRGSPTWHEAEIQTVHDKQGREVHWGVFLEALARFEGEDFRAKDWEDRVIEEIQDEALTQYDPRDYDDREDAR